MESHFCIYEADGISTFQAKPYAGKLIIATIALLIESTSRVMIVSFFCTGAYALSLSCFFSTKKYHLTGIKKERKKEIPA